MSEYQCLPCGYIFIELKEENQKKVKFDELPINWACPDCGSLKEDFEKIEDDSEDE